MKRSIVGCFSASDSSGHAGLQADLRTLSDLQVHGYSVITALTAQNSLGVDAIHPSESSHIQHQWQSLINDAPPKVCKIGLLANPQHIDTLIDIIIHSKNNDGCYWIADPVLQSSTGANFHSTSMIKAYKKLLPHIDLLTPNIPEAEALLGQTLTTTAAIESAAQTFIELGVKAVLIKGGHKSECQSQQTISNHRCQDFFYSPQNINQTNNPTRSDWLSSPRQHQSNTRGTGCTLSTAIAAFIAHGKNCHDALILAHAYTQQGLRHAYQVGQGAGPISNKGWPTQLSDYPCVSHSSAYSPPAPFASCNTNALGLYPVIDSAAWLQKLLTAGVRTIQLRIKNIHGDHLLATLTKAIALGKKYNARLFINDHWQQAIQLGAYGVHLGQEDIDTADIEALRNAGLRLGVSTHSEYEWGRALALRPSYIALGAVYPTQTKPAQVIGLNNLKRWVPLLQQHYLVTAIGGINPQNIDDVLATQVGSIALVTAITQAEDYVTTTQSLLKRIEQSA